ncbi:MAG: TVP38/TMEM64 family protein [Candidatus Hodarchaeota archaeon]
MDLIKTLKDKKTWFILGFLAVLVISFALLYLWIKQPDLLANITINWLVIPVITIGLWGILLYLVVMAVQGLFIPIPSELILLASGLIWGAVGGSFIGIAGSMVAGLLCYFITVKGGRPIAEKIVGKKILDPIDNLIQKHGTWFIFIARAVPMMAFDPISYAAGLLKFEAKKYSIATLVGSIPRSIFFAILGASLMPSGIITNQYDPAQWIAFVNGPEFNGFVSTFNLIFIIILVVLVGMFLFYTFVLNPLLLKKGKKEEKDEEFSDSVEAKVDEEPVES